MKSKLSKHQKVRKDFESVFDSLLRLGKGEEYSSQFYSMFFDRGATGQPKTEEEVYEKIKNAWWVEKEDIKQHLMLCIWRHKLQFNPRTHFVLCRHLKDFLIYHEKIFARQASWHSKYAIQDFYNLKDQEKTKVTFDSKRLKKELNLSTFDYYLIYLSYILELPRKEVSRRLLAQVRQVNRLQNKLLKGVKKRYGEI